MRTFLILFAVLAFSAQAEITPTVRVTNAVPFSDDMDLTNLETAINRQIVAYDAEGLSGSIRFGTKTYPKSILRESLVLLKRVTSVSKDCFKRNPRAKCLSDLNESINDNFAIYRPVPAKTEKGYRAKKTHFTSYYSPDLTGSRVRTARYSRPVYRLPSDPDERNFSRVQIDFQNILSGKGYELFWVEDSFYDLYLLHVQGGGRVKLFNADGSFEYRYLSFAGKNTRTFQMIYHYMKQKGYLKEDTTIPAQRKFLEDHPELQEEIFSFCPSYVYFKETEDEPIGLDNIPLTEGRSLAMDSRIYKTTGIINFVKTVRPTLNSDGRISKVPFSRFFIGQDTGGAIRGNARSDLYAGYGHQAELQAYNTDDLGEQYFLIKK